MAPPTNSPTRLEADLEATSWRWIRALAKGGMGEVHVVEHVDLGTPGVLKVIRDDVQGSTELTVRLRTEARLLKRLEHENLVRVLDFGWTASKRAFLVSEFLDGETLGDRLRRERVLDEAAAIDIGLQTLRGLAVAHRAGLVHRDIKPDNVFLCGPVRSARALVKILDFGVAKTISAEAKEAAGPGIVPTTAGLMVGTPYYMAPEQIMAEEIDARADIYAVGCMLYRMLVGEPPFTGSRQLDIIQAHITDEPEPPHVVAKQPVSLRLSRVVLRALAKARDDRFASAEEMSEALRAVSKPEPTRTGAPAPRADVTVSGTERLATRHVVVASAPAAASARRHDDLEPTTFAGPTASSARAADRKRTRQMAVWQPRLDQSIGSSVDDGATTIDPRPNALARAAASADITNRGLRIALVITIVLLVVVGTALVWSLTRGAQ